MRTLTRMSDTGRVLSCALLASGMLCAEQAAAQSSNWTLASLDRPGLSDDVPRWIDARPVENNESSRLSVWRVSPAHTPLEMARPDLRDEKLALEWRKDWTAVHESTPSGLEVSLTPHASIRWSDSGSSTIAGATVRFGKGLSQLAPDSSDKFAAHRPRWYVFAAGSRRMVGYNFTRRTDGRLTNDGLSQDVGTDSSHALGDAAIGVAWRRGALQSAFAIAYREVDIQGLRGYGGLQTDVEEARVAFQLSIRP